MRKSSIESSEHAIEILEGIITYTQHLPSGDEDAINYAIVAIKERDKLVNTQNTKGLRLLNFVCPKCGWKILVIAEERWESRQILGLQSETQRMGIETDKDYLYLRDGDVMDSEVIETIQYECSRCQFSIGKTEEEAIAWLMSHGMVEEQCDTN
jgi:DNA-directed RNA polymerase subunit RPC12/RpoP